MTTPRQHALLNAMDDAMLVCKQDGTITAWNEQASVALQVNADQLQHASLTQWIPEATWHRLRTDTVPIIVPIHDTSYRMHATALDQHATDAPHWLLHLKTTPSPSSAPSHDLLRDLIESMRAPLASIRAAVETMQQYPQMDPDAAAQFTDVIAEQSVRLTDMLDATGETYTHLYRKHQTLETMDGAALQRWVPTVLRDVLDIPICTTEKAAIGSHVRVDPHTLAQGLAFVSERFVNATRCKALDVDVCASDKVVHLDLTGREGRTITDARLASWKADTVPWGASVMQVTLQAVLDQHDAQLWTNATQDIPSLRLAFPRSLS